MKRARAILNMDGSKKWDGVKRSVWVKERSTAWWDRLNNPGCPDLEFKDAFRMSKHTFEMICGDLEPVLCKQNTILREPIPVRQRVAVCIWRLATGETIRDVSCRFGLGISTCHKLVLEVCAVITRVLMPKYLYWPDAATLEIMKHKFEKLSKIPNIVGSMYTTHVRISKPSEKSPAYVNTRLSERTNKTCYSVTVQGVVDQDGVFTDICIGYPGSMTDEEVLKKSALIDKAVTGNFKGVWIVGNANHVLSIWNLVPYTQGDTWAQRKFNSHIAEVNCVAKEAFKRLKMRWMCLQKRMDMKPQDLNIVIGACCVLHNVCEKRGDAIGSDDIRYDSLDFDAVPDTMVISDDAVRVRDMIANSISHYVP